MCDIPCPDGLDSRSLVPLMEGNTSQWNNETISQYHNQNVMIKRDHLKYQYYGTKMPEVLFDLKRDPKEFENYIDDPTYEKEILEFRSRLAELGHGPNADLSYKNAGY
jgi:choline-sulfatase